MNRIWPALAVVFVVGLAAAAPALGAFPGENGKIAFDSDRRGGDEDIWTMDPDGGNLVNLTAKSRKTTWLRTGGRTGGGSRS